MAKITNRNQSRNPKQYKKECMANMYLMIYQRCDQVSRRSTVSIPCLQATPAVSQFRLNRVNGAFRSHNQCICRTAFDLMTYYMDKLYRYIDYRVYDMLP